jgi:hypothetical protein
VLAKANVGPGTTAELVDDIIGAPARPNVRAFAAFAESAPLFVRNLIRKAISVTLVAAGKDNRVSSKPQARSKP